MLFRGTGVEAFRRALEAAIRSPAALQQWYLSVLNTLAGSLQVEAELIKGLWWAEIDTPEDLMRVRTHFIHQQAKWGQAERAAHPGKL
jgi:choline kinase